jgi:hypothetical protein
MKALTVFDYDIALKQAIGYSHEQEGGTAVLCGQIF